MDKKRRDTLYTLWSGAIVLCVVLAVFSLIFVSCVHS